MENLQLFKDNVRILYHGSSETIEFPMIRKAKFTKDFGWGFYCTEMKEQAERWVLNKFSGGIVNEYIYTENPSLNILKFDRINDIWLDFITQCRDGKHHDYDIIEGPMADDQVFYWANDYLEGRIDKDAFMALCKFSKPTHQVAFCSVKSLDTILFRRSYVHGK